MPLEIRYRPLKELVPNPRNARTHSASQIATLKGLLAHYGWTNSILVASNDIIAGHGRHTAALEMAEQGISIPRNEDPWQAPTVDLSHLSAADRRAYIIADNRSALDSGWDEGLLRIELGELTTIGFDTTLTGFSLGEIDKLFATPRGGRGDPDDLPDAPRETVTQRGDVWCMGDHRLICGDSSDQAAIDALMLGSEATLIFTSPPYAHQRRYGGTAIDDWDAMMQGVFAVLPAAPDAQVLVNLGLVHSNHEWQPYWDAWIEWMRTIGWRRFGWYVWDQGPGLPGDWRGRLAPSHEFIFHFNRSPARVRKTKAAKHAGEMSQGLLRSGEATFTGLRKKGATAIQPTRKPDSVVRVGRHKGALGKGIDHPAVFPVALPAEIIPVFTGLGDVVFDPFCGSGSTILAAESLGRACYAAELEPRYADVCCIRWQRYSGEAAVLEATGESFDDVRQARATPAAAE